MAKDSMGDSVAVDDDDAHRQVVDNGGLAEGEGSRGVGREA
jgi:hypothetical protein